MNKRGQITLFLIVLLVIVIGTSLVLFITLKTPPKELKPIDKQSLVFYIENCLDRAIDVSVKQLCWNGFYTEIRRESYDYILDNETAELLNVSEMQINYLLQGSRNYLRDYSDIEKDFNNLVKERFLECFNEYPHTDDIDYARISKLEINDNGESINAELGFPIKIIEGENIGVIDTFRAESDMTLKGMYEFAELVIDNTLSHPDFIDFGFLFYFEKNIDLVPIENGPYIFFVTEKDFDEDNILMFAMELE
ncbi:hypothetical protein ACFL1H_05145 [Nanoarchaeota archaeon]